METNALVASSLMDDQFDIIDLQAAIKEKERTSNEILSAVRQAAYRAGNRKMDVSDDFRYVVDIDDDMKAAIHNGDIKLDIGKNGDVYAQIRNGSRYGKKLPIKEELTKQGVSVEEISMALQNKAIEAQLETIMNSLNEIQNSIEEIRQGQQNDRIGLLYSGQNMYIEAKSIQNETLRTQIIAQTLKSISDANAQFVQDLRVGIQYIVDKKYMMEKGRSAEKIKEKMERIHDDFKLATKSYVLRAAIYYSENETQAMLTTLDEYGQLIQKMIVPFEGRLCEHDESDVFLQDGIWERRAQSFLEMGSIRKVIEGASQYYLSMKESS